tara:strand:- start:639 stop:2237 length:1599 start_codon:yes stop_codon:yes gene_type:complete
MAFGKADAALIQADKASYGLDEGVNVAASIGAITKGIAGMEAAKIASIKKANQEMDKDWEKNTSEITMSGGERDPQTSASVNNNAQKNKKVYANGNAEQKANAIKDYEKNVKQANEINAARHTSVDNGEVFGPGYDETDMYFSKQFQGGQHTVVEKDGNSMIKIAAPKNYPSLDGYVYFPSSNPPVAMSSWDEGSTAVMGIWNENHNENVKWENNKTAANFTKAYAEKLGTPNYTQAQDLINSDHSDDDIDNSFHTQFTTGAVPSSTYETLDSTKENPQYISVYRGKEVVTFDPAKGKMGGLTDVELAGFLKGTKEDGSRDYGNETRINNFIVEKYSSFMGDITSDSYNKKQKEELIKANRYFNAPKKGSAYGEFSVYDPQLSGKAPEAAEVLTEKKRVYKDMKFDAAVQTGGIQDLNTIDFTTAFSEEGEMFKNLESQYSNYDDVSMNSESGVITVDVDGVIENFDFNTGGKTKDKNQLMKALKNHLNTSKMGGMTDLDSLGSDSSTWFETFAKKSETVPFTMIKKNETQN